MANFYSNYVFPFTEGNFITYVNNHFSSFGVVVGRTIKETEIGLVNIGGVTYRKYRIMPALNDKGIAMFSSGDCCAYSNKDNYLIKKPITKEGNSFESANAIFDIFPDYWIKISRGSETRYIAIYHEQMSEIRGVVWNEKTTLNQTHFQPYEPVGTTIGTLSVKASPWKRAYNSLSIESATNDEEKTITTSFNNTYTTIGTKYATANYLNIASTTWEIEIDDWESKHYEIVEKPTTYKVYAGKEIGSDFLEHFSFVYVQENDYHTLTTTIQETLEKSGLSTTKYYENTFVTFVYTHNGNSANFVDSNKHVINLANGNTKFNMVSRKTSYLQGETLNLNAIDITNSGLLLYSDGTTISLKDVNFISAPSVSCSLGSGSTFYLDETILGFSMTYEMPTEYFGGLSLSFNTSVNGQTEDYITMVVLKGAKTLFHGGEVLSLGNEAYIDCYNANGELKETITADNFSGNITSYPYGYGQQITSSFFVDGAITLTGTFRELRQWSWTFYVSWMENCLILNTEQAKKTYYVNSASEFILNINNLGISARVHNNSENGHSLDTQTIYVNQALITHSPFELESGNRVVNVNVSYTNDYGQIATQTYSVNVILIEPQTLIVNGSNDTTHYYNNDIDTFHYPSGLSFQIRYSDNSVQEISNLSSLEFYRNEALTIRLSIGASVIRVSEGAKIYVYDPLTKTSGYYYIYFDEDTISNVFLANEVNFVLGNKCNDLRNLFEIKALYQSGNVQTITDYSFKNNNHILASTNIIVVVNSVEYTLDTSLITFVSPNINHIELELNDFKTSYTNQSDSVDCKDIVAKVYYDNASYIQTCTFDSDLALDNAHYQITSSHSEMVNYTFDGSEVLDLTMDDESDIEVVLTFTCKSIFTNETTSISQIVHVLEILDIVGISIASVYSNYNVGDTFLNESDNTLIQVFFKDKYQTTKKIITRLNSGFAAINVLPTKGSVFSRAGQKTIRITSATNYNVACEYSIDVSAKYIYENTKSHNLVAIKQDRFTLPNGVEIENHYILIDREDENKMPNTRLLESGERVLVHGKEISNIHVYGYLEDIMDKTKNARVILFEDYISPIDGTNNIDVIYPCYVEGNADKINKCHFGILFGNNNAKNRLFVSGNSDEPNCDWHSGMISDENIEDDSMINGNFAYFEDTSWCYYGETDNKIVGYDIVSNDKLLVLKDKSDKETTIYFRTPTLVAAIDGSGNQMVGIDGETLYQEEFSLIKGNNSVAGVSPKTIINFSGDTLFLSNNNQLVGLDLVGIIGDNQRYANSRSYFIDEDLKERDLTTSYLWSDNKYLFLCLKDKTYVSHVEAKGSGQYEWWAIDIKDIQAAFKIEKNIYFGNSKGELFVFNDKYHDISKVFIGEGGGILVSEGENDNSVIVSQDTISQLDENKKYKFSIITNSVVDSAYMFYSKGAVSNVKGVNIDFYVNISFNALELVCLRNGEMSFEEQKRFTSFIREDRDVYLNHASNDSAIGCSYGSELTNYYKKYRLKRYIPQELHEGGDLYKLYDENGNEINLSELYRATLCYKLDEEYVVGNINKQDCSFKLYLEGEELNLVRYADQLYTRQFRAEIKTYKEVEAFYITKPYTLGDLNYFKTIWQYTLTNDTNIPSELELTYASNKIPYESAKTLAKISVDQFSFSFGAMDFRKIDFDKNITPRTYTSTRILPRQKFICFGFKNYNDTNSVLSSMSIIYSIPHASYSGE